MGATRAAVAGASTARPAALLAAAAARERTLLCPTHGLRLALSAAGVSPMANGLYDLSPMAPARGVAVRLRGVAPRGSSPGGTPRRPLGGDHGQPECQDHRRIWWYQGGMTGANRSKAGNAISW